MAQVGHPLLSEVALFSLDKEDVPFESFQHNRKVLHMFFEQCTMNENIVK